MTTAIKIENLMQPDYPMAAKVELKNKVDGSVRASTLVYPNSALIFNVWKDDVELVVTEVIIPPRI